MKFTMTAAGLALAIGAGSAAAPAGAQPADTAAPAAASSGEQASAAEAAAVAPSKGARKAIVELQTAVNANDVANIPAKIAAAQAVASTPEDAYLIGLLRYKAAFAAKDDAAKASAVEAMVASGKLAQAKIAPLYLELGSSQYNKKQLDQAAASFERALAASPNNADALVMLAETRNAQGRAAEAVSLFKRAIGQSSASGSAAKEEWYKRALALAYGARSPDSVQLGRDWVAAYPTAESWRDALRVYRNLTQPDEAILLDVLRLSRAVGALEGTTDYHQYGYLAVEALSPAEARSVIEEGIAANHIDGNNQLFRDILKEATAKTAGQRERLPALSRDALASPSAKLAVTAANIHYGYGDYAEAAELYRAALGKTGADANLLNLRLGMALARAGDRAGATAALNAVTGPRAELAKFWLLYLATRA